MRYRVCDLDAVRQVFCTDSSRRCVEATSHPASVACHQHVTAHARPSANQSARRRRLSNASDRNGRRVRPRRRHIIDYTQRACTCMQAACMYVARVYAASACAAYIQAACRGAQSACLKHVCRYKHSDNTIIIIPDLFIVRLDWSGSYIG